MKTKTVTLKVKADYFDGENTWTKGETLMLPATVDLSDGYHYTSNRVGGGFRLPRNKFTVTKN